MSHSKYLPGMAVLAWTRLCSPKARALVNTLEHRLHLKRLCPFTSTLVTAEVVVDLVVRDATANCAASLLGLSIGPVFVGAKTSLFSKTFFFNISTSRVSVAASRTFFLYASGSATVTLLLLVLALF